MSRRSHRSSRYDDTSSTASDVSEDGSSLSNEDSLGATKSSNASTSSSSKSSKRRKKPSGSFGSRGDMLDDGAISKAKQAQLERELRTVDTVISEMDEMELCPEDEILYVMTNSVDVQRIATLQQMSKHIDAEDLTQRGKLSHLLLHLLVNIPAYAPSVQVACAGGIADLVPSLDEELQMVVYTQTKKVLFAADASAFSAWCNLFFLSLKHVPSTVLRGDVFEFLAALTDPRMSEKERKFGCKLIASITLTDASLAWRLLPTVQKLALDPLPPVRKSLAESLWPVLEALPRVSVREECIVNPLSRLLLDTAMDVSTATFKIFVQLLTVMDETFVGTFLFPIMLRYSINAPSAAQDVVYASFGRVVYYSRKCFTKKDFENVLAVYTRMCRNVNEQCRKYCASNFLAMCSAFNQQPTLLPKVFELLNSFVTDTSVSVRRSVAAGFHELFGLVLANVAEGDTQTLSGSSVAENALSAVAMGPGLASPGSGGLTSIAMLAAAGNLFSSNEYDNGSLSPLVTQIKLLHANALQLMDDNDLVVRERLFNHVGIYLRSFSEMYRGDVAERRRVLDSVIPPLIKFEQAITTNWRKLSQLLKYFDTFPKYFSFDRLEKDLVPILVGHLVNGAVALKKKIAVTIATFLHTCGTKEEAERTSKAIHTLRILLCGGSSQHRIAFVFFVEGMTTVFSSSFIAMYLMMPLCKLREDPVPAVRSHVGSLLPLLLSIPALSPKAEAELVSPLTRDGDTIVQSKARQAKASARDYLFDAKKDALLAKSEEILLTREVCKAGWDEASVSAPSNAAVYMINTSANNGASSGMSSPITNSPSNDRGDEGHTRRRHSRSPANKDLRRN